MTENKKPLVVLTGPTAVGKTSLSVLLAKEIGGEIISADSMQVYRHMDIGSAKIKPEQTAGIIHHLIDILEPEEEFHVMKFQALAKEAMEQIYARHRIPILVGGTGFYIQSVLYDINFTETKNDAALTEELGKIAATQGVDVLFERLRQIDPKSCKIIHKNNVKRVIRAITFYETTGKRISEHNEEQHKKESPYNFAYFVLQDDRDKLYARIDARVDRMLEEGLIAEVKKLKERGCTSDLVSMQGLGYKEILAYLDGSLLLEEAVYRLKRDTRHFAKRQLTWFKRERDVVRISRPEYENREKDMLSAMLAVLKEKRIIGGDL